MRPVPNSLLKPTYLLILGSTDFVVPKPVRILQVSCFSSTPTELDLVSPSRKLEPQSGPFSDSQIPYGSRNRGVLPPSPSLSGRLGKWAVAYAEACARSRPETRSSSDRHYDLPGGVIISKTRVSGMKENWELEMMNIT